jgi:tetratricopeptide (TPR) repeat protein
MDKKSTFDRVATPYGAAQSACRLQAPLLFAIVLVFLALAPSQSMANRVGDPGCNSDRSMSDEQRVYLYLDAIMVAKSTGTSVLEIPYVYFCRGQSYERLGKIDLAKKDYLHALNIKPDFVEAWLAYGEISEKMGQAGEIQASLDRAVAASPGHVVVLNDVCWARAMTGERLEVALAECDEALRVSPDYSPALDSRCFVRFRMGAFANAIADCDAALKGNSDLATALYVRGLAKNRLGYSAAGGQDLAAAERLDDKIADTFAAHGVSP